ncbi:phage tail fiber protein [Klebsiella variicola]|uniref:phage tail fiber domain-containing protein n=1 Tax=Klebsiella variicola TaxID=244366 RepID=UPI00344CCE1E
MAYITTISTVITYALDGSTKNFTIPFEYLSRSFIVVTLIGVDRKVLTYVTDYTFNSSSVITTNKAWGVSDGYTTIEIRRQTSATERIVDFQNGSVLRANDLNTAQIQAIHVAQEARDLVSDTIGADADGNLDARGRRIVNLGDAVNDSDAVTLRQEKAWGQSALNQANASATSAAAAKVSETNAKTSETNAKASENAAKASQTAAKTSETNAKTSETNAAASAATSTTNANQTAQDRTAVAADKVNVQDNRDYVQSVRDEMMTIAGGPVMVGTNNLSEITNPTTARNNIGAFATSGGTITGAVTINNGSLNVGLSTQTTTVKLSASSQIRDNGTGALIITSNSSGFSGTAKGIYLRPLGDTVSSIQLLGSDTGFYFTGNVTINGNSTVTGTSTLQGVTTVSGSLVNTAQAFLEKSGFYTTGSNRTTNGVRIKGNSDLYADLYHYERVGQEHFFGVHVANGGGDAYYEFSNGGEFRSNSIRMGGSSGQGFIDSFGNIRSSKWGNRWLDSVILDPGTDIGTVMMCRWNGSGSVGYGGTVAGSTLVPANAEGASGSNGTLSGTWRCMGFAQTTNDGHRTTLWRRIS